MTTSKHVPPTSKVASGVGPISSGPERQQVKQPELDQLAPSEQSPAASKLRSTKRRAKRNGRYAARGDDGTARHGKWKRPNAQKAGLYSRPAFIPGEDPREFDQILAELFAYWKPAGPDLRDALRVLAKMKFHQLRLEKYVQTELHRYTFDPHHPAFQEVWGFCMFINYLRTEPEISFDEQARKYLRPNRIDDLRRKFPRTNYESTAEWAKAVMREIISLSMPAERRLGAPELGYTAEDIEQAIREWKTDQQVAGSITYARELFDYEAKETERLNALITKQTKFCAELKLWEQAEQARNNK
jgi:hypothetical protein